MLRPQAISIVKVEGLAEAGADSGLIRRAAERQLREESVRDREEPPAVMDLNRLLLIQRAPKRRPGDGDRDVQLTPVWSREGADKKRRPPDIAPVSASVGSFPLAQ